MRESSTEKSARRGRGPSWDKATIDRAREKRELGDTYQAIADATGVPLGTVQRWTADVTSPDLSGRWTLAEAARGTEPDPAVVMAELGAVILATGGRVTGITRDEARWITLLARVDADTFANAPTTTWRAARAYIRAVTAQTDAEPRRARRTPRHVADAGSLDQQLAIAAAELRWPGLTDRTAVLADKSKRTADALAARKNPFLDGTDYDDGGTRAAQEARKARKDTRP